MISLTTGGAPALCRMRSKPSVEGESSGDSMRLTTNRRRVDFLSRSLPSCLTRHNQFALSTPIVFCCPIVVGGARKSQSGHTHAAGQALVGAQSSEAKSETHLGSNRARRSERRA